MNGAADSIPDDLRTFLSDEANLEVRWGRPYPVEIEWARFFSLAELSVCDFSLCTHEYYLNHDEPGVDPDLRYIITGIDLIKNVHGYEPTGILVWFPRFQEYGAWDSDHAIITMLPRLTWQDIIADPARFANAQWYPERVDYYLLRPWADKRCADLAPEPRRKKR